jgi:hypothetical protein
MGMVVDRTQWKQKSSVIALAYRGLEGVKATCSSQGHTSRKVTNGALAKSSKGFVARASLAFYEQSPGPYCLNDSHPEASLSLAEMSLSGKRPEATER